MVAKKYDCVVVGSGPAGLTAAIYQVRANLSTLVVAGKQPGGQLTITTKVENWPGFEHGVDGVPLMMAMQAQAKNLGVEIAYDLVEGIAKVEGGFEVRMASGERVACRVVIVATGAASRWLGIGEEKFMGKGVSGCATCDGAFFKDKIVAVVGGGDSAVEEAVFLTRFAKKVYVIHRRDSLRAKPKEQERLLANAKVEMVWNTQVVGVEGVERLEKIRLKNNSGEEKEVVVDGLFVAIGGVPATTFLQGVVELKEAGQVVVGTNAEYPFMTSMPGIFAAGDCVDWVYKQAITSAGDGCKAAMDSQKWLEENG